MNKQALLQEKLSPIEINFYQLQNSLLKESFLSMFGGTLKAILTRMFGRLPSTEELQQAIAEEEEQLPATPVSPPDATPANPYSITVKGTDEQINAFLSALKAEYNYMDSYLNHGVDDERTREFKYLLNDSVELFEKTTRLLWPFK